MDGGVARAGTIDGRAEAATGTADGAAGRTGEVAGAVVGAGGAENLGVVARVVAATSNVIRPPGPAGALPWGGDVVVLARRGVVVRVVVRAVAVFFGVALVFFGMHRKPHRNVLMQTPSSPVQSGLPAQSLVD